MPVNENDHKNNQQAGTEQPESYQSQRQAKKEHEKESAKEGVQKAGKTAGAERNRTLYLSLIHI